ncbi:selenide, water dikinase SelD [Roseitranquillus sediminis]|uniref:selenide, water dikinase SelD n=1 Tax=Roseitranquillus sediminis TaxID=2809051 RepID=UPI001D0BF73D|nr:selenide, water dikinase SelD [Roseitranquillus sediminis]MBM9595666.1 selenide, water dikinase SelD [Roseitranquillus sediminis]
MNQVPLTREVVLIGGGHTHALLLKQWGMRPLPGARLTLINPESTAPYTGMLPGFVAGHYRREELEIDLVRLARHAGARLILGRVDGIDRSAGRVHVAGRGWISHDIASLDIGVTSDLPQLEGFAEHGVSAKPLDRLARRWGRLVANPPEQPRIAIIGGGVAGCELAMAMIWRLRDRRPSVTVVEAGEGPTGISPAAARRLAAQMAALGVELVNHAKVKAVSADALHLSDREIPADLVVSAAGARPYGWLAETGLDLTDGYVTVDETLRSVSDPALYAVGDCAHLRHAPRPKAGVYAVREAPILTANLRAELTGRTRRRYRPQRDYLRLISLGRQAALAEKWKMSAAAPALWRWKDRIDRRFMHGLEDLKPMAQPPLPTEMARGVAEALDQKPMCGGCGAKVGGDALSRALSTLPAFPRDDVESLSGDDAAILRIGRIRQVVTTDHLRAFTEDPWTMTRIAAIHAMGDIWAMGAKPQAALAMIVLPRMSTALQEAWLGEIMAAATEVCSAEGAAIVGGHTSLGSELTLGFTVTGLCDSEPLTLAGAQPGDVLILTKPIGSGTILAAEMALEARGPWVAACLTEMQRPQGAAADILAGARAMTDVTGFGLAGHLMNIARASGVAVRLRLDAVPAMAGALDLAARGVRSTIFADNLRHAGAAEPTDPREALLYDPQTAGGLLAAVPATLADDILSRLTKAGYSAARVGEVISGPPSLRVD